METPEEMKNFPPNHYSANYSDSPGRKLPISPMSKGSQERMRKGKAPIDGLELFITILVVGVSLWLIITTIVAINNASGQAF